MASVSVDGADLFYEVVGEGPPCLVMHGGLGFDHTLYRPTIDRLGSELRLIYYDHRGNGRSSRPPVETITMERLADDAAELLSALGTPRALIMGHSYGGFVAQELALRHPRRVAGLILLNTTPGQLGRGESPDDDQGDPPPDEVADAGPEPQTDAELAAFSRELMGHFLHQTPVEAVESLLARTTFSVTAMRRSMEVLQSWSAVDRLGQIEAPTLLLAGRHDVVCSPPQSTRIAQRVPRSEVVVFEQSGHMPFIDEPERFVEVVRRWLEEQERALGL